MVTEAILMISSIWAREIRKSRIPRCWSRRLYHGSFLDRLEVSVLRGGGTTAEARVEASVSVIFDAGSWELMV